MNYPRNTTCYKLGKTETWRRSSASLFGSIGTNLQNIEKGMRRLYSADDGKLFVQVDQSGAEALIVSYLCRAGQLRDLFLHGVKPHVFVALKLFVQHFAKKAPALASALAEAFHTPIQQLKNLPRWKEIDTLIKDSDNWSSTERYYYLAKQVCHCVDKDTEVLTQKGWMKISDCSENEPICVWSKKDESLHFEVPLGWYKGEYKGKMVRFFGKELDQLVTPEHTVVYNSNQKFHTRKAKDALSIDKLCIPTCGYLQGGLSSITPDEARFIVALQADGTLLSASKARFRFKKRRKIDRFRELCAKLNLIAVERIDTDCVTNFMVYGIDKLIAELDTKQWSCALLNWSQDALKAASEELRHWNGTFDESYCHKRESYCTSIRRNSLWVKTLLHLTGKQGTLTHSKKGIHTVGINQRKLSIAYHKAEVDFDGPIYCPTTSTGFFLIRRNSKISVTGNSSNYAITAPALQINILEKSGGTIVISLEEAKHFLTMYTETLFPEIRAWWDAVDKQVERTRCLRNLFGYPRLITETLTDKTKKELYAFIPQSTVALITAKALVQFYHYAKDKPWDILAETHDSYLVQCPEEDALECAKKMKEFIELDLTSPRGEPFRMRSEAQIGKNWAPWKKDKNEDGLKEVKV